MEILKFDGGRSPRNRNRLVTAIVGAFLFAAVGSTFAANISINANSSGSLEYGQGITQAVACNSSILVTPVNRFNNVANGGTFLLETITVTDIDSVTTSASAGFGNCDGKTLRLRAYNDTGTALQLSSGSTPTQCDVRFGSEAWNTTAQVTLVSGCTAQVTGVAKGFNLVFTNPSLNAASIAKITIESL